MGLNGRLHIWEIGGCAKYYVNHGFLHIHGYTEV